MPRILAFLFAIFYLLFAIVTPPLFATQPTCDLCGWCQPNPTPYNHQECVTCLYKDYNTGELNTSSYYTVVGCVSTGKSGAGDFVQATLRIVMGIAGGIGFLAFLGGSAMVLTSSGDPERLKNGKDTIVSSLLGILLIVFSIFLLRVIGFDILKIPGFGG